jgi:hypothetical protein
VDKETCWELVTKTQHIVDVQTLHNIEKSTREKNACEEDDQDHQDFWKDLNSVEFLQIELMPININEEDLQIKRKTQNYVLKGNQLYFKGWLVPKPEERKCIIMEMHHEIGHFGE